MWQIKDFSTEHLKCIIYMMNTYSLLASKNFLLGESGRQIIYVKPEYIYICKPEKKLYPHFSLTYDWALPRRLSNGIN